MFKFKSTTDAKQKKCIFGKLFDDSPNAPLKKGQTKDTVKILIKIPRLKNILEKMDLLVTSCLVFKSLVAATSSEATN